MSFKFSALQEEFLTLLETTDQPQTKGVLCNAEGFCCLGLWTAHRGVNFSRLSKTTTFGITSDCAVFANGEESLLDKKLYSELGLSDPVGSCFSPSHLFSITTLNDAGKSFKEIAEHLRKHPEKYFREMSE